MTNDVQLVWLKRDLRAHDHRPLLEAARRGPTICLYVYEPEVYRASEFDAAHLVFINQSLSELDEALRTLGGRLTCRVGRLPDVFAQLHREVPFNTIWAHEETGNALTFRRDVRVREWTREQGIALHEFAQNGVVRGLKQREGWSSAWRKRMHRELFDCPSMLQTVAGLDHQHLRQPRDLGLAASAKHEVQRGGEQSARNALDSFLQRRGMRYRFEMSSPGTAWEACSRLSPYLAFGNVSMAQVYRATEDRRAALRASPRPPGDPWLQSLQAFSARLRWRCHFIQKLEDQPSIEFDNMCRAYDGMREDEFNDDRFQAWCAGATGYPMVDACMRTLHRSGWINFRMRAMLVSFASYHLWLHWRPTAVFLARHFLDFEPGIHFPQFQMQSGTTGINAVRIYSPTKQAKDQDPNGTFIRSALPELTGVPDEYIHEPHRMPVSVQRQAGCRIGRDYPAPIVEHAKVYREARQRLYAVRGRRETKEEARKVYTRHGSRKRPGLQVRHATRTAQGSDNA